MLDYLDNNGSFPGRYARVHVVRPHASPPDVVEYKVGPLNEAKENITIEQIVADGVINFNQRPSENVENIEIYHFLQPHFPVLNDLLSESFDNGTINEDIYSEKTFLSTSDINDRVSHVTLYLDISYLTTLRLLPVSCLLHHPGINVSRWYVSDWFYLSQGPFNSSEDLQSAYNNGDLRKVTMPIGFKAKHRGELDLKRNATAPAREFAEMPPPRTYSPKGARYTVKGSRVSWMGWDFDFTVSSIRGPAIFDLKFLKQRIAYEISLQDITLLYHPQTNGHGPLMLSDVEYLAAAYTDPKRDLDCPQRGSVLRATVFFSGSPFDLPVACVFEADGQKALWRYSQTGLADHYLVVRTFTTVYNYDYTLEWNFRLDGHVETSLTASGYLYGAFWGEPDFEPTTPFGYRILDYALGPIHDHTYTFKVDLDIVGTSNSFQSVNWKAGESWEPFFKYTNSTNKPSFFYYNHTRYLEHELLERETRLKLDADRPMYWTVVNENENNVWGVQRGYRIIPHSSFNEILPEHPMFHGFEHLKHHMSITKHKDNEQHAADSLYQLTHPEIHLQSINRMVVDNEPIRNEDLVLWINEKFFHVPSAEDVPMTMAVRSGFTLKPFNYFDRSPVFDIPAFYQDGDAPYTYEPCNINV